MGFFNKKANTPPPAPPAEGETAEAPETPIPHAPSAAHLALITERETTSEAYKKAQKAEKQYRTRRQATRARTEYAAAKTHIKTAFHELISGLKAFVSVLMLLHYVLRDKFSTSPEDKQKRKEERTASRRLKLEEKMKRMEAGNNAKDAEEEPAAE